MNELFQDDPISISIIDYLGKIEDGVGLLLSLVIGDNTYELGYWFNKDGHFRIVPDPKLLERLSIDDIYKFEYINEFIYFIHHSLPDTNKILNEFIK
jgi:hypothetical protein